MINIIYDAILGFCVGDVLGELVGGYSNDANVAVSGGLAGMYYHCSNMPQKWRGSIARMDLICKI
jgi:ADP-ribosylglycohydrolase